MPRCTLIKCNNPTPTGGLCASCLRTAAELELLLWGSPGPVFFSAVGDPTDWDTSPVGDPPSLPVAEGPVAEQFDEPQVVHDGK